MRVYYCSETCKWQTTPCDFNHTPKAVYPKDFTKLMNLVESIYQDIVV